MNGPQFMDAAHHYANCEIRFKYGLSGIIKSYAKERIKDNSLTKHQVTFSDCLLEVCESLIRIADGFHKRRRKMSTETDPLSASHVLKQIARHCTPDSACIRQRRFMKLCVQSGLQEKCAMRWTGWALR